MIKKFLIIAVFVQLMLMNPLSVWAQMVSNDNDDEVNRVDARVGQAYREGQVIVKFKSDAPVRVKRNAKGRFQSVGVSDVDRVMRALGVTDAVDLMPLTGAIKGRAPRRAKALSGRTVTEPDLSLLYCLKFEQEGVTVEEAIENMQKLDEVEYAEPNYLVFIQSTGTEDLLSYISEPMYNQQWGLNAIKLPQLWAKDKVETERPIIAILDTGVDITHPDLADNIWTNSQEASGADYEDDDNNGYVDDVHGWDFVAGTAIINNGMDRNGHGTHCAGIAAAVGNNGIGITGANPDAYILPIKVMGDDGTGDIATICRGIDYATACKAHVLSMSFGSPNPSAAMYQSLSKALTNYAVLCGAAGNNGLSIYDRSLFRSGLSFPGAYDIVLGVMASNADGSLASFSNYDPDGPFFSQDNMNKAFSTEVSWNDEAMWNYDVMAPGANILSTYLNGSYKQLNGTSMATPMVAGAVSRILQVKGYDYAKDYGLMGDIAMAKNGGIADFAVLDALMAASYDESNRAVALALTALDIDDSEGDGDGRFDAGETINIWPTVRSLWGHAENIKISIEPYDENTTTDAIEVLDNNVDFGWSLNSRGSFKSKNPIRVRVNDNAYDGMHLPYKIVITSDNLLAGVEQEHVFEIENGIELGGVINEDMTLYPNKHYIVTKNIAIPEGKTLTIMPGTRLEFNEGCYIKDEGTFIAHGKPDSLIVFTTRDPMASWGGIRSHKSTGSYINGNSGYYSSYFIYTNADTTLFTLAPTDLTPIKLSFMQRIRYVPEDWSGSNKIHFRSYLSNFHPELWDEGTAIFMNDKQELMTDPDFITPPMLQMMSDWRELINSYSETPSGEKPNSVVLEFNLIHDKFYYANSKCASLAYCKIDNVQYSNVSPNNSTRDCILTDLRGGMAQNSNYENKLYGCRNNYLDNIWFSFYGLVGYSTYNNYVNHLDALSRTAYSSLFMSNLIHSGYAKTNWTGSRYVYTLQDVVGKDNGITTDHSDYPSWLGTGKEEIIRPYIYDSKNPNVDCFTTVDLSNMPKRPYREAHGIVWKVVVDGYDAQDEFDQLPPLGVGKHHFKVFYNRDDMDTTFTPTVTMGLREPYTQTPIAEGGYWTVEDSASVYNVTLNITGRLQADGLNRIKVTGGKDHDHFDVPDEYWRFNVLVQAAGSMATGFAAEPGLGNVKLTWNNESNDFEDAMGFNVYRYELSEANDTINKVRVNETIIDVEDTEYTDYEVTPGNTYYYYYKVLSTDLKEYDISNVVAATPLTSVLGDANASGDVDVADVITTVNYAAGMEPRPFLFEAADVNVDNEIDILDVIGIIKIITRPDEAPTTGIEAVAEYSVEDGVVYVDCPVALAGVQVTLAADRDATITAGDDLRGFEQVGAWLGEQRYLFLGYNMAGRTLDAGKHAILRIGDGEIADIRLSDRDGHNIVAVPAVATVIDRITADATPAALRGVYDMMGRKVAADASALPRLQPGIYIVNGAKVAVK